MKDDECHYSHSKNGRKEYSLPTTSPLKFETGTNETGSSQYKPSGTSGSLPSTQLSSQPSNKELALRMARIESRLVQLMIHQGLDPYMKVYE